MVNSILAVESRCHLLIPTNCSADFVAYLPQQQATVTGFLPQP